MKKLSGFEFLNLKLSIIYTQKFENIEYYYVKLIYKISLNKNIEQNTLNNINKILLENGISFNYKSKIFKMVTNQEKVRYNYLGASYDQKSNV